MLNLQAGLQRVRVPVYLLTGYLGSGKTSLLARWLKDGALARPALVINEVGEVGLDQHVLSGVAESAALIANTCICCTGLPGMEQALADLFRARLERRLDPFETVIIETTGLADPMPIMDIFESNELLRERYRLFGVITTISATSGLQLLGSHGVMSSQVQAANLVVVTKTDLATLAEVAALHAAIAALNGDAGITRSAQASLGATAMLDLLAAHPLKKPAKQEHAAAVDVVQPEHTAHVGHDHSHHGADTLFLSMPHAFKRQALHAQLERWILKHKQSLLRVKGLVLASDGCLITVQWSIGDEGICMAPFGPRPAGRAEIRPGLTVIVNKNFPRAAWPVLLGAMDAIRTQVD